MLGLNMPARFLAGTLNTLRALGRRGAWERNLEDELRSHVEQRAEDLVRRGVAPREAQRRARLELGSRETYREECRRSFGLRWFDELRQDLRYALRTLRKSPGFTAVAVLSLALGIGANTAVFSVVNALVLRGLPVKSPQEIYFVQGGGVTNSFPNYREMRDRNTRFAGMIAYRIAQFGVETPEGPRRFLGYLASGNYFDVLGVQPVVGRFFHAQDDLKPAASPYAVLSYTAWRSRFAGDPAIAGKTVRISGLPYTILGVAPRGFFGAEMFFWPDVWVPMMMQPVIEGRSWLDNRATFNTMVAGRLKPGATPQQAEANLNAIAQTLAREFPAENAGLKMRLARPGLFGDMLRGTVEAFLLGVMVLAGLVLLAACANLASLLAARTTDRRFELAIRLSIGAGRGRVLRQLLTEALCITMLGGAAGVGLAYGLLGLIARTPPPIDFPVKFEFAPDARVLLFALAASLATGLIFGVAPARRAVRTEPHGALRGMAAGNAHRPWAARDLLLAVQVALCCFLVTSCFVSLRGLARALDTPVGFDTRGLNVAAFDMELAHYNPEEGARFQRRALEAVSQLPGVAAAAYGNSVPLWIDQSRSAVFSEADSDRRLYRGTSAIYYDASPGYFRAMGTRLIAGRDFTWRDDARAPLVGIVNETFARLVFKTRQADALTALGRHYRLGGGPVVEVIGIVEDGKYESLTEPPRPVFFRPAAQSYNDATVLLVRSRLAEGEVAAQLRRAMNALDPQLPVYELGSIRQLLGLAYFPARSATAALSAFGLLAVMLAVTGIYGLAAYTVSRRVREIGIRVALGAQPCQVLRSVMGRTFALLAAGSGAGLALGLVGTRLLASIVYQATPRDPVVLGAVAATMAVVALAAAWAPARRAVSVDPIRSLRHE